MTCTCIMLRIVCRMKLLYDLPDPTLVPCRIISVLPSKHLAIFLGLQAASIPQPFFGHGVRQTPSALVSGTQAHAI